MKDNKSIQKSFTVINRYNLLKKFILSTSKKVLLLAIPGARPDHIFKFFEAVCTDELL